MTTTETRLQRLEALRAAGVAMSRNQHFELFKDPANRSALSLSRYLEALARELVEADDDDVQVADEGDHVVLTLRDPARASRHVARLSRAEFDVLAEQPGVVPTLARVGAF